MDVSQEGMFPSKSAAQGGGKQGDARGCFRDPRALEGWRDGRSQNIVPGGEREACDREGMLRSPGVLGVRAVTRLVLSTKLNPTRCSCVREMAEERRTP